MPTPTEVLGLPLLQVPDLQARIVADSRSSQLRRSGGTRVFLCDTTRAMGQVHRDDHSATTDTVFPSELLLRQRPCGPSCTLPAQRPSTYRSPMPHSLPDRITYSSRKNNQIETQRPSRNDSQVQHNIHDIPYWHWPYYDYLHAHAHASTHAQAQRTRVSHTSDAFCIMHSKRADRLPYDRTMLARLDGVEGPSMLRG